MSQSSSQSTSEAREKARRIAQKQAKRPSGNSSRRWIQASILVVVVAIVAIVAVVVTQSQKTAIPDEGPVPASANQYGGIVITQDGIIQDASPKETRKPTDVETSTVKYTGEDGKETVVPVGLEDPEKAAENGDPVRVTIYQDYECVHCAEFEEKYGDELKKMRSPWRSATSTSWTGRASPTIPPVRRWPRTWWLSRSALSSSLTSRKSSSHARVKAG